MSKNRNSRRKKKTHKYRIRGICVFRGSERAKKYRSPYPSRHREFGVLSIAPDKSETGDFFLRKNNRCHAPFGIAGFTEIGFGCIWVTVVPQYHNNIVSLPTIWYIFEPTLVYMWNVTFGSLQVTWQSKTKKSQKDRRNIIKGSSIFDKQKTKDPVTITTFITGQRKHGSETPCVERICWRDKKYSKK